MSISSTKTAIRKVWPLIKAWGRAVEAGRDGAAELATLREAFRQDPEMVDIALYNAARLHTLCMDNAYLRYNVTTYALSSPEQHYESVMHLIGLLRRDYH